jgi:hypothetical protein
VHASHDILYLVAERVNLLLDDFDLVSCVCNSKFFEELFSFLEGFVLKCDEFINTCHVDCILELAVHEF